MAVNRDEKYMAEAGKSVGSRWRKRCPHEGDFSGEGEL